MVKTKEIVFHRPNVRDILFSSALCGTERVLYAKLIGCLTAGSRHWLHFALLYPSPVFTYTIKKAGITTNAITTCFYAIIRARVLHASPAWREYLNAAGLFEFPTKRSFTG